MVLRCEMESELDDLPPLVEGALVVQVLVAEPELHHRAHDELMRRGLVVEIGRDGVWEVA